MSEDDVIRLEEQVKTLFNLGDRRETRFTDWCNALAQNIKDSDEKWDKRIQGLEEKLTYRLPMWATGLIAALTAACGWLAKN